MRKILDRFCRVRDRLNCWLVALVLYSLVGTNVTSAATNEAEMAEGHIALMQYVSNQQVFGFDTDRVYLVGIGHALVEKFIAPNQVHPQDVAEHARSNLPPQTGNNRQFSGISYESLWNGIDLHYRASDEGLLESVYTIHPQAEVARIQLAYNLDFSIQIDGSLHFRHPEGRGWYSQSAPVAWQIVDGNRHEITVAFVKSPDKQLGFRLGSYDRNYPVHIDPVYQWHTFFGGDGNDVGNAIAVDDAGNIYIAGTSTSAWLGPNDAAPLHAFTKFDEIMIMKLDSAGTYQWHTFYGSATGADFGFGIAVDGDNVYVTGRTGDSWQGDGNIDPLHASSFFEIVVIKLDSNGAYQWHTFYGAGSSGFDFGHGIDTDGQGNVYVTGYSNASWQGDGDTDPLNAHGGSGNNEVVVLKLDSDGAYQWHTFYGGSASDKGNAVAASTNGNVYIAGWSAASWQGPGDSDPKHAYAANANIMVMKLDTDGTYQWHTFYGAPANGWDIGEGIALDPTENVYVTGYTQAPWQGDNNTEPLHPHAGDSSGSNYDMTVLKLNSDGAYQWHTYYGSNTSNDDEGNAVTVDTMGNIFVAGLSRANWLGDDGKAPLHAHSTGGNDFAILKLANDGSYKWHTFYGSLAAGSDEGLGIAIDAVGNLLVSGSSPGSWMGDGNVDPLNDYSADQDIAVISIQDSDSVEGCSFYVVRTANGKVAAFCI